MPAFDADSKRTSAVFLKTKRDGRVVYIREPYNLVIYNHDDNTTAFTGIEGKREWVLEQLSKQAAVDPTEQYDEIMIVDQPLNSQTRFGRN